MRIAVVAPSSRFESAEQVAEVAARVGAIAHANHPGVVLFFHPQCREADGHFAGSDGQRASALIEVANDPEVDAVWFARGGYGSNRIAAPALAAFGPAARAKAWLGYSDSGFLLAALHRAGHGDVAHGPMPKDVLMAGGDAAVARALAWLVERSPGAIEPGLTAARPAMAFNLTVLSTLLGTPLEPDFTGRELLIEDVAEYLYATDRTLFHVTSSATVRRAAGIRLGRIAVKANPGQPFGADAEAVAMRWCRESGISYLGRADIGHDAGNKVVPFS